MCNKMQWLIAILERDISYFACFTGIKVLATTTYKLAHALGKSDL